MITLRRFSNLWNGRRFAVAWIEQVIVLKDIATKGLA
jgi:hypothetical protein